MKTWIKIALGIWIAMVLAFGVAMPIGDIPGLGSKARIIFFHVPMSWLAVVAFFMAMWYGIVYLRRKQIKYDIKSATAAELGFIFSILATITGSIWAKFNWGSFWNWDPRDFDFRSAFNLRRLLFTSQRSRSRGATRFPIGCLFDRRFCDRSFFRFHNAADNVQSSPRRRRLGSTDRQC